MVKKSVFIYKKDKKSRIKKLFRINVKKERIFSFLSLLLTNIMIEYKLREDEDLEVFVK
jgi:hypothetical protein